MEMGDQACRRGWGSFQEEVLRESVRGGGGVRLNWQLQRSEPRPLSRNQQNQSKPACDGGGGMSSRCLFQQISTFGFIFWEEIVIISIEETVIAYFPKSLSWETSQVLLEPPKVSPSWQCARQDVAAMVMEITDVLQIL